MSAALPALIVCVGAGLLAWRGGFDGLYGQDAFAYFNYAVGPLRDSLARAEWPPPFFWPPGYPLLVALIAGIVGPVPFAGQLVSLCAGMLVPVATAWLCKELLLATPIGASSRAHSGALRLLMSPPVLAGVVTACCGQLWQLSVAVMSDTTALAAATLGAASLARYARTLRGWWLVLAAGALAWAVLTRWVYAFVAIPCGACALFVCAQQRSFRAIRHALAATVVSVVVFAPVAGPLLAQATGQAPEHAPFVGSLQITGWHPLNFLRRTFDNIEGHVSYRLPNGLYYAVAPARSFSFTPLLALFIVSGLVATWRSRALTPILLLVAWPAVVWGFLAGMGMPGQNARYALVYLPPLAILLAIGFVQTFQIASQRLRMPLAILLLLGLALMVRGGVQLTQTYIDRKAEHLEVVRWTERHMPSDARLVTFALTHTFRHYSGLDTLELFELDHEALADLADDPRSTFLLVDVDSIEGRWLGLSPSNNFRWLRERPGLTEVGRAGEFTLYRISK
jgi:4-amino-4-deoxy-L-arabinose transferase-like glycosyltransferase